MEMNFSFVAKKKKNVKKKYFVHVQASSWRKLVSVQRVLCVWVCVCVDDWVALWGLEAGIQRMECKAVQPCLKMGFNNGLW